MPNETIRRMLFSYIQTSYSEAGIFNADFMQLNELINDMAYDGEWRPLFEYFGEELRRQTSIRDYIEGEKAMQTFHMVYMSLTNQYIIWPERELNKGYCDLWLSPNLVNHPQMKYS